MEHPHRLELQVYPNNLDSHHHALDQPISSSIPPDRGLSISSSSLFSSQSNSSPMTNTNPIHAGHYSKLFHDDGSGSGSVSGSGLWIDIKDPTTLCTEHDRSTLLHLAASVSQLGVFDLFKQQIQVQNANGDLPLHVAARSCQIEAVNSLISLARQQDLLSILETKNKDHNTALHIALENHQKEMAKVLFENCPQTFHYLNLQGFSPLYLAIHAEFWELAIDMLSREETGEAENNLLLGKSVVHAAIAAKNKDVLLKLSENYGELIYKTRDELGRTPLSCAACSGFLDGVDCIISHENFQNDAYKIDENGYFPIHWACRGGNIKVVNNFFSVYPKKTKWLLTTKGQNILHVAAEFGKAEVVKHILQQPELETMINMKDEDGNTPFHLGAKGKHPRVVYYFTWDKRVKISAQNKSGLTALDIAEDYGEIPSFAERLTWLSLTCAGVPRAPQFHSINFINMMSDQNNTTTTQNPAAYVALADQQRNIGNNLLVHHHPILKPKAKYKDRIGTLLVVSILAATVTFASGFTVPGGFKQEDTDEGMAILAHKHAFQVFVITNTIALYSSILAAVTLIWAHLDDLRLILMSLDFALPLLGLALSMMSVAFTSGLYVVLHDVVSWLAIVVLAMEVVFLGALLVIFVPLHMPFSCIRNNVMRYVFHIPFSLMLFACEKGRDRNTFSII